MTEIDEVAAAIQAKYPMLWPMTAYQASYVAEKEAGDQGDTIVNLVAQALLKLNNDDQARSDAAFNFKQLFRRACVALGLAEDECSWFDVVGQIEKSATAGPAGAFTTQLFTALHACDPGSSLIYDEGHELVSTDEIRYASGDGVMIEFSDGEEYLFLDQEVLVDSGGCCPVSDAEGRQFYFTLQVARPFTAADLEKKP